LCPPIAFGGGEIETEYPASLEKSRGSCSTGPTIDRASSRSGSRQRRRISLANERAPVERVGVLHLHRELRLAQRLCTSFAGQEPAVEFLHQLPRWLIGYLPQAHDQRLGPGQDERPPQAEDSLPDMNLTQSGLAGREHHQLCGQQVQPHDVLSSQQAVLGL